MSAPKGKGQIVNWDTGDCYKCNRRFKGKVGLWVHVTRSKAHNKVKMKLHQELLAQVQKKKQAQKTLDLFV